MKQILPDKVYQILKWIAITVLPALSTFVVAMGDIWGLTNATKIGATITAFATFLGVLLAVASATYSNTDNTTTTKEE